MAIDIKIYETAGQLAAELRRFWEGNYTRYIGTRSSPSKLGTPEQCYRIVVKKDRLVVEPLRTGVHTLLVSRVPHEYAGIRVVLIDPCDECKTSVEPMRDGNG